MKRAVTVLVLLAVPQISLAAAPFFLSLDEASVDAVPPGWTVSKTGQGPGSEWAVVEDTTAPGGKALAQTSDRGPRPLFSLCIADRTSLQDVDLTVSFKAVSGKIDIVEKPWLDDRVTQNLHWDGYGKHHQRDV